MKKINLLCTLLIMLGMVGISELLGENEIIFPEILALLIGSLVVPKQPWQVSKSKLVGLMTLSSIVGIVITRYVSLPVFFKITLAFSFTALSLMISRTTLVPMISACILPILLNTRTWIYPLSVALLCLLMTMIQWALEKASLRERSPYMSNLYDLKEECFLWLKRLVLFMLIAIIPCLTNHFYLIAPPLIVSFVELTHTESKLRKMPIKLILTITLASIIGMGTRLLLNESLGLSLTLCTLLSTLLTLALMKKFNLFFPPAGAIAILPMILSPTTLLYYPIQIVIGMSVLTILSLVCFPNKSGKTRSADSDLPLTA